ncbi:MAG: hypothetical protein CM15mV17_0110 [Caudoviricetes sp.]|nr:MAG: hypothetical protein CM15mV17_0110 [Caudoviricetes sp.]
MPLTATKTTPRLDTYQTLLLNAIRTYGSGDWKNGVSIHHKHDQSMFSNILIGGEVVAKVVYEEAHDDISIEEYRAIHIEKTQFARVSYIAFGDDLSAYRDDYQVTRYKNVLKKLGFLIIKVSNKCIVY